MKEIMAQLNNYRQSPRKVRIVANAIRGKSVKEAKDKLDFIIKRASGPLHKLLNSAVANAKNLGAQLENLWIKNITVNGGKILYRHMPVAHGAAHTIHKRTSHVKIILEEREPKVAKTKIKNKK